METVAVSSVEKLSGYGPVGLACAFLVLAVVYLVRRNEKQDELHRAELKALADQHRAEMKAEREGLVALYNRYVSEAKEWKEQGDETAGRLLAGVDSMIRLMRGGGS
jgi:hypothetical protein